MTDGRLQTLQTWIRLRGRRLLSGPFGKLGLIALGFALGALVFGLRTCGTPEPHGGHTQHGDVGEQSGEGAQSGAGIWTCSMHPQIRKSEPGQCPMCGMDLIPVTSGEEPQRAGVERIVLSERARALAKLRTVAVRPRRGTASEVPLLGRVEPDETTLRTITAWTGGRIDRLHVNVTGQRVRTGQTIATLYSPEVFAAHQDLLVAKRQVGRMTQSPESSRAAAMAALEAARERLRLLGVPDDALARMETRERPTRAMAIRTPFAGTVIERVASEGAYVATGAPLYRIANLTRLWVQLDAYESDLARISLEQPVRVEVDALPGEQFEGKVTFIDPTLDAQRRTARVRVEVDNRDGRLRPGMFVEASVSVGAGAEQRTSLVVPSTAPLFTGRRALVYVEVRDGDRTAYEPRTVRLGPRLGDFYPVVAGLSEGERVVTRGAFALDADMQIRGGASMMASADDRVPGVFDAAIALPKSERKRLAPIASEYLKVQRALAADDLAQAQHAAEALEQAVAAVKLSKPREAAAAWPLVAEGLRVSAHHVRFARDLEVARAAFEGLSGSMQGLLRRFGNPLDKPLRLAFCPMALGSDGASWIQQGQEIDNAYFGASMRSCGEVRQELAPGSYLRAPEVKASPAEGAAASRGHRH